MPWRTTTWGPGLSHPSTPGPLVTYRLLRQPTAMLLLKGCGGAGAGRPKSFVGWVTQSYDQACPSVCVYVCVCVCHTTNPLVYRLIVASPSRRTTNRPWKGRGYVTWHVLIFGGPIHISGMAEARTLKFCTKRDFTVSQKNCTPKAGRHKFIKITSPIMIFHTRHHHSIADRLSSKSLVWVEYQLQGFHGNQAPWQTTVGIK